MAVPICFSAAETPATTSRHERKAHAELAVHDPHQHQAVSKPCMIADHNSVVQRASDIRQESCSNSERTVPKMLALPIAGRC